jgi:hypothetical protein
VIGDDGGEVRVGERRLRPWGGRGGRLQEVDGGREGCGVAGVGS